MDSNIATTATTDVENTARLLRHWLADSKTDWHEVQRAAARMAVEPRTSSTRTALALTEVVALLAQGKTREAREQAGALALYAALVLPAEAWGVVWRVQGEAVRRTTDREALIEALT
jgi:alkylated DNA nucleotide flippase Atl1